MNKKMKKLEQETNTWKGKYESCAKSLTTIAEHVRTQSLSLYN